MFCLNPRLRSGSEEPFDSFVSKPLIATPTSVTYMVTGGNPLNDLAPEPYAEARSELRWRRYPQGRRRGLADRRPTVSGRKGVYAD
jgi:hypothetical protein